MRIKLECEKQALKDKAENAMRLCRLIIIALLCILVNVLSRSTLVLAQSNTRTVLLNTEFYNLEFSADSQVLHFWAPGTTVYQGQYFKYTPSSNQLENLQVPWLYQAQTLTADERRRFGIDSTGNDRFARTSFFSPDGQFFVFPTPVGPPIEGSCGSPEILAIGDRSSGTILRTDVVVMSFGIRVWWSADGTSFILSEEAACEGLEGPGPTIWGHRSDNTVGSFVFTRIRDLLPATGESISSNIAIEKLHQISPSGRYILLTLVDYDVINSDKSYRRSLLLLDRISLGESSIVSFSAENIVAAGFKSGDADAILVINAQGLIELSRNGVVNRVIDSSLSIREGNRTDVSEDNFVIKAAFSNDGRWFAYLHTNTKFQVGELSIRDLLAPITTVTPSPTNTPTPTPTNTAIPSLTPTPSPAP